MFHTPMRLDLHEGVLVVSGSVDEQSLGTLRDRLREATAASELQQVDVSDVEFLPSAAVGILARTWSAAREREEDLTIVAAPGSAAEQILALTGIPHVSERRASPPAG